MAFVSVTRLRIRALRFLPGFALHAIRTRDQVRRAPGFLGGAILPDRAWTFWTMTAWDDAARMRHYMLAGAHRLAMPRLIRWCDESAIVHWTQEDETLPSWIEADRRMRAEGRPSKLPHPSPEHLAMTFPTPRTTGSTPIRPAGAAGGEPARH